MAGALGRRRIEAAPSIDRNHTNAADRHQPRPAVTHEMDVLLVRMVYATATKGRVTLYCVAILPVRLGCACKVLEDV